MKKLLLLLLGCAAAFSSCLKNDRFENDVVKNGLLMYQYVLSQNLMTLDPFNVAFRLNTLIVEGQGDYQAAPQAAFEKLFGVGTTIAFDEATGNYKITYTGTKSDFYRNGVVIIQTNGYATLGENMARWNVSTPAGTSYKLGIALSNMADIFPANSSYTIENTGNNAWSVSTYAFISSLGNQTIDGQTVECKSNWTATYNIVQMTGTQSLADIGKSVYSVKTFASGTTMYMPLENGKMSVTNEVPLKYNPGCGMTPVGDGDMYISGQNDITMTNGVWAQVLGTDTKVCYPKTRITYGGYSREYIVQMD